MPAGHGLSAAADQQLAVAIMWAVPALCFPPVIYCMVITWLRDSEDPEEEFRKAGDGDSEHRHGAETWHRDGCTIEWHIIVTSRHGHEMGVAD